MGLFWWFFKTLCGGGAFFVLNEGIPTVPGDDACCLMPFVLHMKENGLVASCRYCITKNQASDGFM